MPRSATSRRSTSRRSSATASGPVLRWPASSRPTARSPTLRARSTAARSTSTRPAMRTRAAAISRAPRSQLRPTTLRCARRCLPASAFDRAFAARFAARATPASCRTIDPDLLGSLAGSVIHTLAVRARPARPAADSNRSPTPGCTAVRRPARSRPAPACTLIEISQRTCRSGTSFVRRTHKETWS